MVVVVVLGAALTFPFPPFLLFLPLPLHSIITTFPPPFPGNMN